MPCGRSSASTGVSDDGAGLDADLAVEVAEVHPAAGGDAPLPLEGVRLAAALLRAGSSNKEIAGALQLSVATVSNHLQSIYRKLNVSSRREARLLARELGLQ